MKAKSCSDLASSANLSLSFPQERPPIEAALHYMAQPIAGIV
jgi:hypothetical protein